MINNKFEPVIVINAINEFMMIDKQMKGGVAWTALRGAL